MVIYQSLKGVVSCLDPVCRLQVQISVYCARRIPTFNPVSPYRYLFPTLYLFVADIANLDLFVCSLSVLNLSLHRPLL